MSPTWLTTHGAAAIKCKETTFAISADDEGSSVHPTSTESSALKGSILFPLPSFPSNAAYLTNVAIYFSSTSATVEELIVLYGYDELYKKKRMGKTSDFSISIPTSEDVKILSDDIMRSLAISVSVKFESMSSSLLFRCVGVGVSVAPSASVVKFESGTWDITDVRDWQDTTSKTQERIDFKTEFKAVPMVTASMNGADVSNEDNFRVKVYVTGVDTKGFTVHADSWAKTKLYSCGVSWVAMGI
ncbi:hypothetical protein QBC38DRAFT_489826 [Podospora fimiseda]|uniref:H-type lectin domain-containing protein n=1 Tax=Podospora fimiseda TaxID=252190 RepID=A0AAN6YPB2_9PEZI|nr:hypothetical protein QBC38DRAFT_489826 [Podospora fimiseda]